MANEAGPAPTIGILYPGELGSSLGRLLAARGVPVVTTVAGRGPRTEALAEAAGLTLVDSPAELVHGSDLVISLVPPAAALEVAHDVCHCLSATSRLRVFMDGNSISPASARQIGELISETSVRFVDAAIHGLASRLATDGTLYLSGEAAEEVAEIFSACLAVRVLGTEPGAASAQKMLLGGMSKGLVALFLELTQLAGRAGLLDETLAGYRRYYPGLMEAIDRLLPTYQQHAARRADELRELERTMDAHGLRPGMVHEAQRTIAALGRSQGGRESFSGPGPSSPFRVPPEKDSRPLSLSGEKTRRASSQANTTQEQHV